MTFPKDHLRSWNGLNVWKPFPLFRYTSRTKKLKIFERDQVSVCWLSCSVLQISSVGYQLTSGPNRTGPEPAWKRSNAFGHLDPVESGRTSLITFIAGERISVRLQQLLDCKYFNGPPKSCTCPSARWLSGYATRKTVMLTRGLTDRVISRQKER